MLRSKDRDQSVLIEN
jgi:NTE family protein